MLNEGQRMIDPKSVIEQLKLEEMDGVVVLCLGKPGKTNKIAMSSITVAELSFLSKQLDAHIASLFGPMTEHE